MQAQSITSAKTAWLITLLVIILAILFSTGVIGSVNKPSGKLDFPKDWKKDVKLALIITNDRGVFLIDKDGVPAKSCNTCTSKREKKWGDGCKKAPKKANICGPLKSVIPRETITIQSGYGSDCWFAYPSGGRLIGYPSGCIL